MRPRSGKVDRFNGTGLAQSACARPYGAYAERLEAPHGFLHPNDDARPHLALRGETPMAVLINHVSVKPAASTYGASASCVLGPDPPR